MINPLTEWAMRILRILFNLAGVIALFAAVILSYLYML